MHTILGANGIIGVELAKELRSKYSGDIKLVGRNPKKIHEQDLIYTADLLNPEEVHAALADTKIAYLTVGLPYKSSVWLSDWEKIMRNTISGCKAQKCKLVYFDNTYAYPQDSMIQTEDTPLTSKGKKGTGKRFAADVLLHSINNAEIDAVICRAPEFYGPGKTKGITNSMVFQNIKKGRPVRIFLRDDVLRTLIFTPDASKAMALIANTPDAYGQTWHLPCDDNRLTYKEFIGVISKQLGRALEYEILGAFKLRLAALLNSNIRETLELLPRYNIDNIFDSSKFKQRFPDFKITTYPEGIAHIIEDYQIV